MEEDEIKAKENDWNMSDTIKWSDELKDFDIEEFSGLDIKINVANNISPNYSFSYHFGTLLLIQLWKKDSKI